MSERCTDVLFPAPPNAGRSILAEAMLNHIGKGHFKAYSAGSSPCANQQPNPLAMQTLAAAGISTQGLHSKSWDAFATPDAPHMDLIITVCDNAAGEVCPIWPRHLSTVHWGTPDPAAITVRGEEKVAARFCASCMRLGTGWTCCW